jgi:hypothetical protein
METNQLICEAIKSLSDDGALSPYPEYSGRCMYGRKCLGVTTDNPTAAVAYIIGQVLTNLRDIPEEDMPNELLIDCMDRVIAHLGMGSRTDSMGLDSILYWPDITLTPEQVALFEGDEDDE